PFFLWPTLRWADTIDPYHPTLSGYTWSKRGPTAMWNTLALTMALLSEVPGQGTLRVTNERLTFGLLGPTRPTNKILPGDVLVLVYDIENLKADEKTGKVFYSMALKATDTKGKTIFEQKATPMEELMGLGGTTLPGF